MSLLKRGTLILALTLLALLTLYVGLGRLLMPWVGEYRNEVEARAATALDEPVRLGRLEGHWAVWNPVLVLRDLTLGRGDSAVQLDHLKVVPDVFASLWHRQLRLRSVQIDGVHLVLQEDAQGHWQLRGLPPRQPDAKPFDPAPVLDALARLDHASLLDSQLSLIPRQGSPVTLRYVEASLSRQLNGSLALATRFRLPDGGTVAAYLDASPRPQDWRASALRGYVSLPASDWSRWVPAELLQQWQLRRAQAEGELWFDWAEGRLQRSRLQLRAADLTLAYAERAPVRLEALQLDVAQDGTAAPQQVALALKSRLDGQPLEGRFGLVYDSAAQHLQVRGDQLDLAQAARLAKDLAPLPAPVAQAVQALAPHGQLRNLNADLYPQKPLAERLTYATNVERLGFAAYRGAPAADGITGSLSGSLGGGELRLDTSDFMLHLADLFPEPWRYRTAKARLTWSLDDQRFTLGSALMQVTGPEGTASGDLHIQLGRHPEVDSYMDLRVGLKDGDASYTRKYLPTRLPAADFSPELAQWLSTAIVGGRIDEAIYQYQGSLRHGSPAHSRTMSLFFRVHDAQLAYQPGWPALRQARGDVFIENDGVKVQVPEGRILDTRVRDVEAFIPLLHDGSAPHLKLTARLDSSVRDGLKILQEAPLPTAKVFAGWKGEGALADSGLSLDIPLAKAQPPVVVVDLTADKARLELADPKLILTDIRGAFRYDTRSGLSAPDIQARAFDQPLRGQALAEGKPDAPRTRLVLDGRVDVDQLARWLGSGDRPLPARGLLGYRLGLTLADHSELAVTSDLRGVSIDLPAPFGKGADEAREGFFSLALNDGERRVEATYKGVADAVLLLDPAAVAKGRGEIVLGGGTANLPANAGYDLRGRLAEFDLSAWQGVYQRYLAPPVGDGGGGGQGAGNRPDVSSLGRGDLTFGRFLAFGQEIDDLRLTYEPQDSAWQLGLTSQAVTGQVRIPRQTGQPIDVNLQQLRIPQTPADPSVASDVPRPDPLADVDPRKLPALNLVIDRLELGGRLVGAQRLQLRPSPSGANFNALDLDLRGLKVQGALRWEGAPGATRSYYQGRLSGGNIADILLGWNFASSVTSRDFRLDARVDWPGSPAYVALARLNGSLDARFNNGQLQQVEGTASALRIFGLLNFESIRRRLRLDFSDLFGKGLSYDSITGVLDAQQGAFRTRKPITLSGPGAEMSLQGLLDMASNRVDADLKVGLPVSNSLPLAALIAGAPAIGGALFIVDRLIGDRLTRMASINYHIEGPWQNPTMTTGKRD
ncbi:YhdP family protein [Pseudomonas oryzihabitans]|uniref:YhdP family protein n=1 Tax=Pseudomonas oryzihabitans TaxID=47885 RepID=UPI002893B82A|nr:YhdP family protein [Pseudomonas oryzihabitans]MDT3718556.1 YhdP family protein [Pseudomonas oryzihabitans]